MKLPYILYKNINMSKKTEFVGKLAAAYYAAEQEKHPRVPPASVTHGVDMVVRGVLTAVLAAHEAGKLSLDDETPDSLMTAIAPFLDAPAPTKRAPRKSIVEKAIEVVTGSEKPAPKKSAAKPAAPKSALKPATAKPAGKGK